jgi:hypothetical protein
MQFYFLATQCVGLDFQNALSQKQNTRIVGGASAMGILTMQYYCQHLEK